MMTENERVRMIRKAKSLTLEKFGERIGVGKTAISKIESGERGVTDQMCRSICREFNINEMWLRTGEGEMYTAANHFDLNEYAKQCGASDIDIEIIRIYLSLPSEFRSGIVDAFRSAFHLHSKDNTLNGTKEIYLHVSDTTHQAMEEEIEAKVEAYRRQFLDEKKAEEASKASQAESWNPEEKLA